MLDNSLVFKFHRAVPQQDRVDVVFNAIMNDVIPLFSVILTMGEDNKETKCWFVEISQPSPLYSPDGVNLPGTIRAGDALRKLVEKKFMGQATAKLHQYYQWGVSVNMGRDNTKSLWEKLQSEDFSTEA